MNTNSKRGIDLTGCHTLAVKTEALSLFGTREIRRVIREYRESMGWGYCYYSVVPNCDWRINIPSTGQQGEWAGALHRRIAKWWEHNGKPLSDTVKSAIANLVRQHTETSVIEYHFRFRIGHRINWEAGDFGHGGSSCWWSDYRAGFEEFKEEGGAAICFYKSAEACKAHDIGEGIARAWIWRDGDTAYLFNSYGMTLEEISSVLAIHWGIPAKPARVECDSGALYINGCHHYKFGAGPDYFDLPISAASGERCGGCGCSISEDEEYVTDSGHHYCESCYYERYDRCTYCGEEVSQEDCKRTPDGEACCDYHWEKRCCECYACEETIWLDDATEGPDGEWYCSGCHSAKFAECEECGEISEREHGKEISGEWYCEDCAPNWQECSECGERISSDSPDGLCGDCALERNFPQDDTLADDSHFAIALVAAQS